MSLLNKALPVISIAALAGIFVAASASLTGDIDRSTANASMLACTIAWFATAPFWIGREKQQAPSKVDRRR